MSERIGIVTGGGDCPGLNAVIRAVAKAAAKRGGRRSAFSAAMRGSWSHKGMSNHGGDRTFEDGAADGRPGAHRTGLGDLPGR